MKKKIGLIGLLLVLLSGCAEKGPILLDIGYLRLEGKTAFATKVVAGLSPLRDDRGKPASVLGKRRIPSGLQNDLVVQGTVAEMATRGIKNALIAHGIAVKDAVWDLTAEGMNANGIDILFGGEIKTLWLESTATPLKTSLKASIQLKIVAGDPGEKKIIRTLDVNSVVEQDILYSREKLENALSEALSAALEQIFKDDELKKKFQ